MKLLAIILLLCLTLSGCSDYRGLDEQTIVMGIAIDADEDEAGGLIVTFEAIDMDSLSASAKSLETMLIETKGKTFTQAVRAANAKLHRNMYLGNAETVILSSKLARETGLSAFVDPLMRESEVRTTLTVLISGEDSAKDLLDESGKIVSLYLTQNIVTEQISANATRPYKLYEINQILKEGASGLALPVIRFSDRDDKELTLDGLAMFSGDKLTDYISEDDAAYYLLAKTKLSGGAFMLEDGDDYVVAEIRRGSPSLDYRYDGHTLNLTVSVDAVLSAVEFSPGWGDTDAQAIRKLEQDFAAMLSGNTHRVIEDAMHSHGVDIIGFGSKIHKSDPALWHSLKPDWPELIREAEIIVNCNVRIQDTGMMR